MQTMNPEPSTAVQACAPFEHVEEASPEVLFQTTLDYDMLDDEWNGDEKSDSASDAGSTYDISSMSHEDEGSMQSSPRACSLELESVLKQRVRHHPPGIPVWFDDDSWID